MNLYVKNLTKSYGKKIILDNINFKLEPNNIYGLFGINGAGKTTLIKSIFNEVKKSDDSIYIHNHSLNMNDYEEMYYFPDNTDLPGDMLIYDYLAKLNMLANNDMKKYKEQVIELGKELIPDININKTKNKSLSSGQQKLVSLMGCILIRPKIIFFDEPTANLDIANKELLLSMIVKLKTENNIIVLTTHLIEEVSPYIEHMLILNNNKIIFDRKIETKEKNKLKTIFLESIQLDKNQDNENEVRS